MARTRKSGASKPLGQDPPLCTDEASLVAMLSELLNGRRAGDGDEALERAQVKAFDAMEASDRRTRIRLAREALAISPLCGDGYYVLGLEAKTRGEKLDLYRQAVEAGAKALGEAAFEEDVGHFWGLIETRPYMRARHALALELAASGKPEEAADHYRELLRLNPGDNQGIRYLLLDLLLALGRDAEAAALLRTYKDDGSAAWDWSAALLSFRRHGDGSASRKVLSRAAAANAHVAFYLLGRKRLPRVMPEYIQWGEESEAVAYVAGARSAWEAAPGALQWLQSGPAGSAPVAARPTGREEKDELDEERIDEAVLALLLLGRHDGWRAWKGFDWDAMERLHAKGLISDPKGRTKSVVFSEEGLEAARAAQRRLFAKRR